ncbi:FAD-dependent oxidoreductase [Nonomuraea sp. NPDC050404]|uniref:FAD-dependent oxidoreductase n=1 Tax=Nonomuraea sp. NPDC050404 TaxID=3155783 RepID=UPI0033C4B5B4
MDEDVIVIGAGVSGLTTAICLAEAGRRVRVWTAEPTASTVSMVASALWGPSFVEPVDRTLAWSERSLAAFQELALLPESGVRMASVVTVGELPPASMLPPQVTMIPDLRPCEPDELPPEFPAGYRATMPLMDMPRYLAHLTARLEAAGGTIELRRVDSLSEAAEAAPTIVNCSGLGARELAGDPEVRPVWGQFVVLSNPGLTECFLELTTATESTSFTPHADRVLCGAIAVPDATGTEPDPELTARILDRCRRIEPRLADAEVLGTLVGLRPGRSSVRVEAETIGAARCVHNYGHGSSGVSLSWGCAQEAAALALDRS